MRDINSLYSHSTDNQLNHRQLLHVKHQTNQSRGYREDKQWQELKQYLKSGRNWNNTSSQSGNAFKTRHVYMKSSWQFKETTYLLLVSKSYLRCWMNRGDHYSRGHISPTIYRDKKKILITRTLVSWRGFSLDWVNSTAVVRPDNKTRQEKRKQTHEQMERILLSRPLVPQEFLYLQPIISREIRRQGSLPSISSHV